LREDISRIQPRVAFGWAALREKILCAEHGLDDVTLELLKLSTIRGLDNIPLRHDTELRLVSIEGSELVLAWIEPVTEKLVETLRVPRDLYDEIVTEKKGWQILRSELEGGPFVDLQRLLLPEGAGS
jgi:hypothetical protein